MKLIKVRIFEGFKELTIADEIIKILFEIRSDEKNKKVYFLKK